MAAYWADSAKMAQDSNSYARMQQARKARAQTSVNTNLYLDITAGYKDPIIHTLWRLYSTVRMWWHAKSTCIIMSLKYTKLIENLLPSLMMNLKIKQQGVQTLHLTPYFNKPRRSESDSSLSFPSPSVSKSSQVSVPRTATSKIFNSCRATTKYTASLFAFTKHNHIQCWWSAWTINGNQRYICLLDSRQRWKHKTICYPVKLPTLEYLILKSNTHTTTETGEVNTCNTRPFRRSFGCKRACLKNAAACPLHILSPSNFGRLTIERPHQCSSNNFNSSSTSHFQTSLMTSNMNKQKPQIEPQWADPKTT